MRKTEKERDEPKRSKISPKLAKIYI